jgi:hypothetical protein
MMVAPIETTLELWASTLRDVKRRTRGLFAQERTAVNAGLFLDGLLERFQFDWNLGLPARVRDVIHRSPAIVGGYYGLAAWSVLLSGST